jgi:hypothetical protein
VILNRSRRPAARILERDHDEREGGSAPTRRAVVPLGKNSLQITRTAREVDLGFGNSPLSRETGRRIATERARHRSTALSSAACRVVSSPRVVGSQASSTTLWHAVARQRGHQTRRLDGVLGTVGFELLHQLVVYPEDQERGGPLSNEQADMPVSHHLQRRRHCHRSHSHPEKRIGWQLCRLCLNAFATAPSEWASSLRMKLVAIVTPFLLRHPVCQTRVRGNYDAPARRRTALPISASTIPRARRSRRSFRSARSFCFASSMQSNGTCGATRRKSMTSCGSTKSA